MNKGFRNISWAVLFVLPMFLFGQEESALSAKDQKKFDYFFYRAQQYKQIERYDEAFEAFEECYDIDPKNATIAYELGRLSRALKKPEEALTYLQKAYELEPENKWFALELAKYYKDLGIYSQSTVIYEKLVKANAENVGYHFELAQLYYSQNRLEDCLETLNQIEVLIGINQELSAQKKDIYLQLDNTEGAEQELIRLEQAYPADIEYKGMLAQFYMANDDYDKAIVVYRQMIALNESDPRAHLDLANIYRQQNKFDTSYYHLKIALASPNLEVDNKIQVLYSIFKLSETDTSLLPMGYELLEISINATPNEPKLHALLGDYYLQENRFEDARNSFRKATRLGANQLQIWSQILLLDAQTGNNDSLVTDGEAVIELYPNQPLGYLMAGNGYIQTKDFRKATNLLEAGLDFVLDNPELEEQFYITLADAHHRAKEHRESDEYFEKALEINPRNPTTLNNYAYYLSVRGVNLAKAEEMTEKCNQLAPNNGVFLDTWAWVLYKNSKYGKALEKMEACAKYGGAESGEVLEHWGDILFKLGRVDEALEKWKSAAEKGDASADIQQKISQQQLYD